MASGIGESASSSKDPQNSNSAFSGNSGNSDAGSFVFECNICFELAQDPVVTLCGHLFCRPCLYKWLHGHAQSSECPVCKTIVEEEKLVPLYGRGKNSTDPRSKATPGGNYTFSAAIGGLFPLLSFQVHGFPAATATYGPGNGFPYGYGHGQAFHGGHHAHGFPREVHNGQQANVYLKALSFLVGALMMDGNQLAIVWRSDYVHKFLPCLEKKILQQGVLYRFHYNFIC
ncbi:uncharacterized protein LOC141816376 isoform X2 [Curcuma longa]|uniref:uncharacterized protein LOC141816376 isoform X2 n=1 Tax=Curcuma longa TaxID=136217 RepID=UPI003D9F7668